MRFIFEYILLIVNVSHYVSGIFWTILSNLSVGFIYLWVNAFLQPSVILTMIYIVFLWILTEKESSTTKRDVA